MRCELRGEVEQGCGTDPAGRSPGGSVLRRSPGSAPASSSAPPSPPPPGSRWPLEAAAPAGRDKYLLFINIYKIFYFIFPCLQALVEPGPAGGQAGLEHVEEDGEERRHPEHPLVTPQHRQGVQGQVLLGVRGEG